MSPKDKPLVWLGGDIQSPPFSKAARLQAGFLLRMLQHGKTLSMPHSRTMTTIGKRCHELRINDAAKTWRIVYRTDVDAIVILEVFEKKSRQTPRAIIEICKQRFKDYDNA